MAGSTPNRLAFPCMRHGTALLFFTVFFLNPEACVCNRPLCQETVPGAGLAQTGSPRSDARKEYTAKFSQFYDLLGAKSAGSDTSFGPPSSVFYLACTGTGPFEQDYGNNSARQCSHDAARSLVLQLWKTADYCGKCGIGWWLAQPRPRPQLSLQDRTSMSVAHLPRKWHLGISKQVGRIPEDVDGIAARAASRRPLRQRAPPVACAAQGSRQEQDSATYCHSHAGQSRRGETVDRWHQDALWGKRPSLLAYACARPATSSPPPKPCMPVQVQWAAVNNS